MVQLKFKVNFLGDVGSRFLKLAVSDDVVSVELHFKASRHSGPTIPCDEASIAK
jgi:hypothetical protein